MIHENSLCLRRYSRTYQRHWQPPTISEAVILIPRCCLSAAPREWRPVWSRKPAMTLLRWSSRESSAGSPGTISAIISRPWSCSAPAGARSAAFCVSSSRCGGGPAAMSADPTPWTGCPSTSAADRPMGRHTAAPVRALGNHPHHAYRNGIRHQLTLRDVREGIHSRRIDRFLHSLISEPCPFVDTAGSAVLPFSFINQQLPGR